MMFECGDPGSAPPLLTSNKTLAVDRGLFGAGKKTLRAGQAITEIPARPLSFSSFTGLLIADKTTTIKHLFWY